jgi:hypothetical protein
VPASDPKISTNSSDAPSATRACSANCSVVANKTVSLTSFLNRIEVAEVLLRDRQYLARGAAPSDRPHYHFAPACAPPSIRMFSPFTIGADSR